MLRTLILAITYAYVWYGLSRSLLGDIRMEYRNFRNATYTAPFSPLYGLLHARRLRRDYLAHIASLGTPDFHLDTF